MIPSGKPKPAPRRAQPTVGVEVRGESRVDYHFPVEIHLDAQGDQVDIDKIAEQVYERLIRRIDDV